MREEMVESGLERKKSQPAMLASLALVYFFRAGREPVRKRYQLSQIIQQSPVTDRTSQSPAQVTSFILANNCNFSEENV